MPTYEYKCPKCGHIFEALQQITDTSLRDCPKCNTKAKRLISSGVEIIFKGSGFYATDYRKKPQSPDACPKIKDGCTGCKG